MITPPKDSAAASALAKFEKANSNKKPTKKDIRQVIRNIEKVREHIGEYGKGVTVSLKDKHPSSKTALASMVLSGLFRGPTKTMTLYRAFFKSKGRSKSGVYEIVHEMGYGVLGLTDKAPGWHNKLGIYRGSQGVDANGSKSARMYGIRGINRARKLGFEINDVFACTAVGC